MWWRGNCLYGVLNLSRPRLTKASGSCMTKALCRTRPLAPGRHWRVLAVAAARSLADLRIIACHPHSTCQALTLTATYGMDSHGCMPGTPYSSDEWIVCARRLTHGVARSS